MRSSQAAFDLIVEEEVSSERLYTRSYSHFDWPGGSSGVTIGIGYDLGYCSKGEIKQDWAGLVTDQTLGLLLAAQGLKAGYADAFVRANKTSITIPWSAAMAEFGGREMPKWENRLTLALANTGLLTPDCFGALDSLIYNRGAGGFTGSGDRYREMRAIRALMSTQQFALIPAQIRSMKRLWNNGLVIRREREALLFERGLKVGEDPKPPIPTRRELAVKTAAKAAVISGASGGAVALPTAPAHWIIPVAVIVCSIVAVCVSLYLSRHRLLPKADPVMEGHP